MKRSIQVRSHGEGDAVARVLDVPALKAVQVIAGMLLELDEPERRSVLQIVQQSLQLANPVEPARLPVAALVSAHAGSSGE